MRQVVRASLPLGTGTVLDPFMGSGSTIAAACAVGYQSVGVEVDNMYFDIASRAIPALAGLETKGIESINEFRGVINLDSKTSTHGKRR